ncbi:MAG: hypothetical protein E7092_00165 [Bacteroidales bacterium]|nr:hypothetical protein [Bacteroidales bacterium]
MKIKGCFPLFKSNIIARIQIYVLMIFLFIPSAGFCVEDYYDRHIIIAVDQKAIRDYGDYSKARDSLFAAIKSFLRNDGKISGMNKTMSYISPGVYFDKETDKVSLFAFGIPGTDQYSYDDSPYARLKRSLRYDYSFNKISDSLIKSRAVYTKSGDLEKFLNSLKLVFYNDEIHKQKKQYGNCILSLSHYVDPLIINHIDASVKAREYYLFIVTDYTSGGGANDTGDIRRMEELLGMKKPNSKRNLSDFNTNVNNLISKYSRTEILKILPSGFGERDQVDQIQDFPIIKGKKLLLAGSECSTLFVASDIRLKQLELDEPFYNLQPSKITFAHSGDIVLEKIMFTIKDKKGKVLLNEIFDDSEQLKAMYNKTDKGYEIPAVNELNISNLAVGDSLFFDYVFYTKSSNENGANTVLPYVFVANKEYLVTDDVFVPRPQMSNSDLAMIFLSILIILSVGTILLYWLYKKRGQNRVVNLDFKIWPITNERFMEVKNKQVLKYDCWYWDGQRRDHNIRVTGNLNIEEKSWAKKFKYIVEFWIEDIDANADFSFRPSLQKREANGNVRDSRQWYPVQEDSDGTGNFSCDANVFISDGEKPSLTKVPNFSFDNILELKVKVRVKMVDNDGKFIKFVKISNSDTDCIEKVYSFIVKPKLENSNVWMAFDPGTTGSCAAFGVSALPTDSDDIFLAINRHESESGDIINDPLFPSRIRINNKSKRLFANTPAPAEQLIEGEDFDFGNKAEIFWKAKSSNCFQSIKKLLGYTNLQKIVDSQGRISEISGQDLAHLLVKGLYKHTKEYIESNANNFQNISSMFMKNGSFHPQRAIVAVPNNYTLVKIQEMVDSVKRIGAFNEVHYIYESESVMMTYIRSNWKLLFEQRDEQQEKVYIVFDMGGATINATAFKLNVYPDIVRGKANDISSIDVETISKIGYGVGGDDIDYAIIQLIYGIPTIKALIADVEKHQREHKTALIELARKIKLSWISSYNGSRKAGGITNNIHDFWTELGNTFKYSFKLSIPMYTEEDAAYLNKESEKHTLMKKYVLDSVKNAVMNLLSTIENKSDIVLIMSGRSVLYPGINGAVDAALTSAGCEKIDKWKGYCDKNGVFDSEKVKSAVAIGACWYAMYSDRINMINNIVTTSFGYIDYVEGEQKFIPIVERNSRYDANGECSGFVQTMGSTLRTVRLVQMLGMNYDEIYSTPIKHMMNVLDEVLPQQINTYVNKVEITVDNKNNFSYTIYDGVNEITKMNNPHSRLGDNDVKTEIVDENSSAYVYATLNENDLNVNKNQETTSSDVETTHANEGATKTIILEKNTTKRF